jgi:hypothetical protein
MAPSKPLPLRQGQGYFDYEYWGDYSYTTLDPEDGLTFWTVQAFAKQTQLRPQWGTWIGAIEPALPPSMQPEPSPLDSSLLP